MFTSEIIQKSNLVNIKRSINSTSSQGKKTFYLWMLTTLDKINQSINRLDRITCGGSLKSIMTEKGWCYRVDLSMEDFISIIYAQWLDLPLCISRNFAFERWFGVTQLASTRYLDHVTSILHFNSNVKVWSCKTSNNFEL